MNYPIISIVIPTYNSEKVLEIALKGIANQKCSKSYYEVIVSDNDSTDHTVELAKKYGARVVTVDGKAPQVCRQRNAGAKKAKGEYILMLDHDVELSRNFIGDFVELVKTRKRGIDAWYIPYKIVARGELLTKIRNFEEEFYRHSVIAAARIIKKETYWRTDDQYDPRLSFGPADWDFDIQLKLIGARFDYFKDYVYHHEEDMDFWRYLSKKASWARDEEIYKDKWYKKNVKVYRGIIRKQYSPFYRLFWIFIENGKWKRLVRNIHLYLLFLGIKLTMIAFYFCSLKMKKR